jgi:hypothetical protein
LMVPEVRLHSPVAPVVHPPVPVQPPLHCPLTVTEDAGS